jgi:Fe-S cluster biogenesis protein NfuA
MMTEESQKRIDMIVDPKEDKRLMDLDIIELVSSSSADTVPALMARLGVVRAALIGHGGALVLHSHSINKDQAGTESLSLVIDLDGACVSCGAAPGTLKGIQDDLLADPKISRVRFNKGMLDWFTEIQREFVLEHGGVTFA